MMCRHEVEVITYRGHDQVGHCRDCGARLRDYPLSEYLKYDPEDFGHMSSLEWLLPPVVRPKASRGAGGNSHYDFYCNLWREGCETCPAEDCRATGSYRARVRGKKHLSVFKVGKIPEIQHDDPYEVHKHIRG